MFRFLAALALIASPAFGQTLRENLASTQPREVAWAANTIAQQKHYELLPDLAALVDRWKTAPVDDSAPVTPDTASMEAVADALIQLEAKLPAATVMHLYPQFPAQTIILLSHSPDNSDALLEIFRTTPWRDLWLAAGNLLVKKPPPGFVRSLLAGVVDTFDFRVVPPASPSDDPQYAEGCAADFFMAPDKTFQDWPKARMYRLITSGRPPNTFAPGLHPVGFSYWETTDYRDSWTDGDCSPAKSRYWRRGLIARQLEPELQETIAFDSIASLEDHIKSAIEKQSWAFDDIIAQFVRSGALSIEDSWLLHLKCRINIQDPRPLPRVELPSFDGRWCPIAPPPSSLPD